MPKRDRKRFPSWAERERASDPAWIGEKLHVFWPNARQGHKEHGRGAIVVDITQRPSGEGYPFGYFPRAMREQTGGEDTERMVKEHDPRWEVVTVLLKTHDRISTYRVGVLLRKPKE